MGKQNVNVTSREGCQPWLHGSTDPLVSMRTMGHGSPSTAMKYQHPELEQVRRVLNDTNSNYNPEQGLNGTFYGTVTKQ